MKLFKISLTWQMAIATILGIICGLFFGDLCKVFSPWASAYIMLLKVTAVPYLIAAIMHGVGKLTTSQGKEILKKGLIFISLAWFINILTIYLISFSFPHANGYRHASYISQTSSSLNFAELLIPENIFYDLANNIVPAVVVFSLFIGLALMHLREKQSMMGMLETLIDALTRITAWIARITPLGTFIIIANQIGTVQFSTIKQVSTYIILYIFGICILIFWVFPRLTSMLTSMSGLKWLKDLLPILLLAYTTNVVIVCLPYIIQLIQKESAAYHLKEEKVQSQIQGTVSIVFNLPLGSLFICVFVFFIAIFYNTSLSFTNQIELVLTTFLTGLGAIGLGSWINSLTFLLDSLGLPMEALNMYLVTLPFTAGFQSMLSSMQIATISLLITLACRQAISFKWSKIVKSTVITLAPIIVLFIVTKLFNPLPKIQNLSKSIYDLSINSSLSSEQPQLDPESNSSIVDDGVFGRILESKTLRIGVYPGVVPFCFYNNYGELTGYDIAFAHELAKDLGCSLEFVPLNYPTIAEELSNHLYDIGMSAISIDEERLKFISFTQPYINAKLVFVYTGKLGKKLSSLETIQNNPSINIAVLKGSVYEKMAKELFPDHNVILLNSYNSFLTCPAPCALFWEEQEAIAWVMCNPKFKIAFPEPSIGTDSLGYAINPHSVRLQSYMNQWLELKKTEGFMQKQYDIWILGKTAPSTREEPRWSVIRNIFHWID
jgi:Na+/H+-dicarboxylate symporter/ABC-type amino acid transport substrate-binding protein